MPRFTDVRALMVLAAALLVGCGDKEDKAECEGEEASCDGDILSECVDGVLENTDCAADDMICHDMDEDSHCMAADDGMEM